MRTTIYYYTATGNSLALARRISDELGDAEVQPIAKLRKETFRPEAERIGMVFPIHAWGPPRSVEEFIGGIDLSKARFVFAIASCGGTPAGALPRLRASLRKKGGDLHAGFVVRSPGYMADSGGGGDARKMIELVRRHSGKPFGTDQERLTEIVRAVRECRPSPPEHSAFVGSMLGNFFHGMAIPRFATMDANYKVAESCESCGTCARVCPRENVRLEAGRPTWNHDCDNCGACATWCPNGAIGFTGVAAPPRPHHSEVALRDVVLR